MKATKQTITNTAFVTLGILSAGFGLKGFLLSSRFIDGGVTGVSMLIAALSPVPVWVPILLLNLPFILVGYRQIGRTFALKSTLAIAGLALALALIHYPDVTPDKLLTAVFGGFFLGAGIGLAMRGGAVLDGTEIAALLLSKKAPVTVGDVILVFNIVIFAVAAFFLGVESALYSMLTYFAASRTIDFILHGIEEYNGVIIVSAQNEAIKAAIINDLGRGVTVYQGRGGLTDTEMDNLFCVVTRLELYRLKSLIEELDANAFVVIHPISDVSGGVVKRRALH
ncbi:MAG: YitT family protein [Acidobacteria bacterium]|nr:YitT family protein [Acidobacteriota bacterium]MBI3426902.1 YitT family protein [Acidobacteriota bacterium]